MTDLYSHLFLHDGRIKQLFFWKDRVNIGAFVSPHHASAAQKVLRHAFRSNGQRLLLVAPYPIHSSDASEFYCYPEDALEVQKLVMDNVPEKEKCPMTDSEKKAISATAAFAVRSILQKRHDIMEATLDSLISHSWTTAAPKMKRRRADLAELIDAVVAASEAKAREEASEKNPPAPAKRQFVDPFQFAETSSAPAKRQNTASCEAVPDEE